MMFDQVTTEGSFINKLSTALNAAMILQLQVLGLDMAAQVILISGINFINILLEIFLPIFFRQKLQSCVWV